jgi:hydrogenase maturation protein HypF
MLNPKPSRPPEAASPAAQRLVLGGRVQGLGVRPAIYRLASFLGLAGSVRNTIRGVEIEVEGDAEAVAQFARRLPEFMPAGARIERLATEAIEPAGATEFTIVRDPQNGPLGTRIPADMRVCDDCLREIFDQADRRFRYPFTSCTACGPRYTIIERMPYERHDITMSVFAFCQPCRREYEAPGNRRFHAQTNACAACGPEVWSVTASDRSSLRGDDAIRAAGSALRHGRILALRGIGGYQLLADATCEQSVSRLRELKRRRAKPLAVMVHSAAQAQEFSQLDSVELELLDDRSNPIVLADARTDRTLAPSVSSGFATLGLMLPTTPLHAMLASDLQTPLVCTSGNLEGETLAYEIEEAEKDLAGLCDLWLHHNRPISRPLDDSVVRGMDGRSVTIRLARGLAPLALDIEDAPPMLALGGHFKNAVAWTNGAQAVLGPHIGDLDGVACRRRYLDQCEDWQNLYRGSPRYLVHDLHPEYYSTIWAQQQGLPTIGVQHHHAHVAAGMLEHGWLDRTVLGIAWDGTGYGLDGTIWGGEFLIARAGGFERIGHLRPFRLPGGEAAIHAPWRIALSIAAELFGKDEAARWPWGPAASAKLAALLPILDRPTFSPRTTSAGRLFDAAAVFILGREEAGFEGHLAMLLEATADRRASGEYDFPMTSGAPFQLDWRPLFQGLLADRIQGTAPAVMAMRFHRTLARAAVRVWQQRQHLPVVLGGGVFQNRLLVELISEMVPGLLRSSFGRPAMIPPNDGGLAAGQLAVAAAKIREQV